MSVFSPCPSPLFLRAVSSSSELFSVILLCSPCSHLPHSSIHSSAIFADIFQPPPKNDTFMNQHKMCSSYSSKKHCHAQEVSSPAALPECWESPADTYLCIPYLSRQQLCFLCVRFCSKTQRYNYQEHIFPTTSHLLFPTSQQLVPGAPSFCIKMFFLKNKQSGFTRTAFCRL